MKTKIPIIRALFGNLESTKREIPIFPINTPQIVYVWGEENEKFLKDRGFETRLQSLDDLPKYVKQESMLITKLISIDLALQEFGEIIFLDWDCYILREFDDNFYGHMQEKPIQCPAYSHYKEPMESFTEMKVDIHEDELKFFKILDESFKKYNWKFNDMLVVPNFGFFYSRDKSIGKKLLDIAIENEFHGCVDELALFSYTNCTLDEYINKYHPLVVQGVAEEMTNTGLKISNVQKEWNTYISNKLNMDIYLKHM